MNDLLPNGLPFRILTVVDQYIHACPLLLDDISIDRRKASEGISLSPIINVDNVPEFADKVLDEWAYGHGIQLEYIRLDRFTMG